jgi:hypothetical protein
MDLQVRKKKIGNNVENVLLPIVSCHPGAAIASFGEFPPKMSSMCCSLLFPVILVPQLRFLVSSRQNKQVSHAVGLSGGALNKK